MDRRLVFRLLVVALLASLAGCSAEGSLSMEPVENDEQLATLASDNPEETGHPDERARSVVEAAIKNGTATVNATEPPVETAAPVAHTGSYYNISRQRAGETTEREVTLWLDTNATNNTGTTVQFDELPDVDRRAVDALLMRKDIGDQRPEEETDVRIQRVYSDTELNTSVLVTQSQYDAVTHEGETYPISVGQTREVTVDTYEYTATQLARNTTEYADELRESDTVTFDSLSGDQRDIVDEAADGTYYADSTSDDAFRAIVDQFVAHEAVQRQDGEGEWLVRYDGQFYLATVYYAEFASDAEVETISRTT